MKIVRCRYDREQQQQNTADYNQEGSRSNQILVLTLNLPTPEAGSRDGQRQPNQIENQFHLGSKRYFPDSLMLAIGPNGSQC